MPDARYMKPAHRYALVGADGEEINYSVTPHMLAEGYADRFPGSRVESIDYMVEVNASEKVLIDSAIPEEHWPLLRADAHRAMNMCRDAGRPSDAMRSAVRA